MSDTETAPPSPIPEQVVVRGRPRKTIAEQIYSINAKTVDLEAKRKEHNDKMKKYYHDNKEAILLKKKAKRDASKAT